VVGIRIVCAESSRKNTSRLSLPPFGFAALASLVRTPFGSKWRYTVAASLFAAMIHENARYM
jgi:hypothetical protein